MSESFIARASSLMASFMAYMLIPLIWHIVASAAGAENWILSYQQSMFLGCAASFAVYAGIRLTYAITSSASIFEAFTPITPGEASVEMTNNANASERAKIRAIARKEVEKYQTEILEEIEEHKKDAENMRALNRELAYLLKDKLDVSIEKERKLKELIEKAWGDDCRDCALAEPQTQGSVKNG